MRFMKNSSRLEVKMARNFALSSSGVRSSSASASTRSLKSSQLRSRSIQTDCSSVGSEAFRAPWSPTDAKTVVAIEFSADPFRFYGPPTRRSMNSRLHVGSDHRSGVKETAGPSTTLRFGRDDTSAWDWDVGYRNICLGWGVGAQTELSSRPERTRIPCH